MESTMNTTTDQPDYKALFVNLFREVAAAESPEGSQVDDVLGTYQDNFDQAAERKFEEK